MRNGSHSDFSGLLAASMSILFFANHHDWHGDGPLLSLCADPEPMSFGHLAVREKRRGNQDCAKRSRAGYSG